MERTLFKIHLKKDYINNFKEKKTSLLKIFHFNSIIDLEYINKISCLVL